MTNMYIYICIYLGSKIKGKQNGLSLLSLFPFSFFLFFSYKHTFHRVQYSRVGGRCGVEWSGVVWSGIGDQLVNGQFSLVHSVIPCLFSRKHLASPKHPSFLPLHLETCKTHTRTRTHTRTHTHLYIHTYICICTISLVPVHARTMTLKTRKRAAPYLLFPVSWLFSPFPISLRVEKV